MKEVICIKDLVACHFDGKKNTWSETACIIGGLFLCEINI